MIIRNVDGKVFVIPDVSVEQEEEFLQKNPTGGFGRIDKLPYAKYGNYKMIAGKVVVDEEAEAISASKQYQLDRKYPSIEEQLDMIWHAIDNDSLDKTSDFYTVIKTVKESVPKGSEIQ